MAVYVIGGEAAVVGESSCQGSPGRESVKGKLCLIIKVLD